MGKISLTFILAVVGLILTNLFWAGNASLARLYRADISAFDLNFYRWVLSFSILTVLVAPRLRQDWQVLWHYRYKLLILGALSVSYFNFALYQAAKTTTAINIGLFNSLAPVITVLLSCFILSETLQRSTIIGMLLSFTGALAILTQGQWQVLLLLTFQVGDLVMLSGCLAWGVYTVLLKKWPIKINPLSQLWATVATGLLLVLPIKLFFFADIGFNHNDTHLWTTIAYTAIFPAILAYLFWSNGIRHLGPAIGSLSLYLNPCFIALLGYLLLDDSFGWHHLGGAALILLGLMCVFLPQIMANKSINNS